MNRRPLVGVTGPERGGAAAWIMTAAAVFRAGGMARRITASNRASDELDALVVGGGADVDPAIYQETARALGEVVDASAGDVARGTTPASSKLIAPALFLFRKALARRAGALDPDRDALERRMIEGVAARERPILGICRGAQMMNVHFGGTLYLDVAELYAEAPQVRSVLPRTRVSIKPGSHLADAIGGSPCTVNALHHQAVRSLGSGMVVAAAEANGVVQAVERSAHAFQIGVQWHPEFIPQHRRQQELFAALVSAAR